MHPDRRVLQRDPVRPQPFTSVFTATQRFDLANLIGVTTRLLTAGGIVFTLWNGLGLIGVSAATCGASAIDYIVRWQVAQRLAPQVEVQLRHASWQRVREISAFGAWNFLVSINAFVYQHVPNILIASVMPIAAVGHYALATGLTRQINSVLSPVPQVFYPAATELHVRGDQRGLERLYHDGSRLMLLVMISVVLPAAFWAEDFYRLWIGEKYLSGVPFQSVAVLFQILLISVVSDYSSGIAGQIPVVVWRWRSSTQRAPPAGGGPLPRWIRFLMQPLRRLLRRPRLIERRPHCTRRAGMTSADPDRAVQEEIRQSLATFHRLVGTAEAFLAQKKYLEAAVAAQIAGSYASYNHTGAFASPRLEHVLLAIGSHTTGAVQDGGRRRSGVVRRVLHVVTAAADVGGDSRFVWRWIQKDTGRSHSVALTYQRDQELPQVLVDAVATSGGTSHVLDAEDVIGRARALRRIARNADVVFLHVYPEDVVPLIAFANRANLPPIAFVVQADHQFWLGVGISDLIVHLRDSGRVLSVARRGIGPERMGFLPIPLDHVRSQNSRARAKEKLGFPEDTVVLLSIARAFKYEPSCGPGFAEVAAIITEKHTATRSCWSLVQLTSASGKRAMTERLAGFWRRGVVATHGISMKPLTST